MDQTGGGERGLTFLRALAQGCVGCRLWRTRTRVVFGTGPVTAPLLILGEAPGEDEDNGGVPFGGRAGIALDGLLASAGVDRAAVYVANVVLCRPDATPPAVNRQPTAQEIAACAPFLDLQLAAVRPEVILALGETATERLLGPISSVAAVRGRAHPVGNLLVVPTWHPAAWHWAADRRDEAHADLLMARALAQHPRSQSPALASAGSRLASP